MGSVYRALVAVNRRPESSRHSRELAFSRLIAQLARHAGAAAGAGVRVIGHGRSACASQTHPVSPQTEQGMTVTATASP